MHGTALLAAAAAGALAATSLVSCHGNAACPAIAAAPFLTLHIAAGVAATLDPTSVTATACQDTACHGGPLPLADEHAAGSAAPGKIGQINMGSLTETPIDLTVSGRDLLGKPLGDYRLQFVPHIAYPWGYSCPRVITVGALLDGTGLHPVAS